VREREKEREKERETERERENERERERESLGPKTEVAMCFLGFSISKMSTRGNMIKSAHASYTLNENFN
jgi:hypothetical protein